MKRALLARAGPRLRGMVELSTISHRLERLEQAVQNLEYFSNGSRATYMGRNRVLVRIVVAGANLAYFVEADDKLLTPWFVATGMYETELTNFFVRHLNPDSKCLDIGSNFGYFTCLMARRCPGGRVIGVEPNQAIFELAHDNVAANGLADVATVHRAAASSTDAEVTLFRRHTRSGNTSIAAAPEHFTRHMREDPVTEFKVPGTTVDKLVDELQGQVDFIKVDVEGAEPYVLEGAQRTLRNNPQLAIVMEWAPYQIRDAGTEPATFANRICELGLQAFDLVNGQEKALGWEELAGLPYRAGIVLRRA